ncbi:MAG: PqqD family protein [Holophagaceae bacterium]|nr:PqqD family protein [Holophagaceae bacterium]
MEHMINPSDILVRSSCCVVRDQESGKLVYNPHTDELHLVPPTGFLAIELCDGLKTAGEIATGLASAFDIPPEEVRVALLSFFGKLVDRGILQIYERET